MIDKSRGRFLDFPHFVVRRCEIRSSVRALGWLLIALYWASLGCTPRPFSGAAEDSLTSGRISITCAPEAIGLVTQERAAFQRLYPRARIEIKPGASREAIAALFEASSDLAVITRELDPEERRAAVQGRLEVEGFRFARAAVVAIVNPSNPVENLAIDDLRRIYRGDVTRWSALNGADLGIVPVFQPVRSDISEYFAQDVMGLEPVRAHVAYARSDSEVVARVRSDAGGIGYVSLGGPIAGVKTLRLASLTGLPYWRPDLEAVYQGIYPLTRTFSMYVRAGGKRLANGFITFVTSMDGQKIVRDEGLVPTAVPVRFVRRSPMVGSH